MFLRNQKTDEEIFIEQLYVVRDIVYEMYDAAQTLIELLDPQEEENGQA